VTDLDFVVWWEGRGGGKDNFKVDLAAKFNNLENLSKFNNFRFPCL